MKNAPSDTAAARSHAAATASMKTFFKPRTVAVIGANRARGTIGSEILHNLVAGAFSGRLFVVHPTASSVEGVPAFPTVTAIPSDVDLAIICVPCASVSATVDECIAKGVKALVVISSGFAETGVSGRALEAAILDSVRAAGIRMIGPNCMGMLDIPDEKSLCDAFAALKTRLGDTMTGAVVQQMVPGGVELLVGAVVDPVFGPLVACGERWRARRPPW